VLRSPLLALSAALLFAACGTEVHPGGAIVVPPPASPGAEPSPLVQAAVNINHIHGLASRDGGKRLLIAGHHGVFLAGHGGANPQPVGNGSIGGDVLALFYAPDGTLFAGGHLVGVKVSHDDGQTFNDASPDLKGADVHGLAIDPSHPSRLYAYAVGKGILVSEDSGATWTHRPGDADTNYVSGLAVTADGTLLVGTPGRGVAASTDHGASFVVIRDNTGPVYSMSASTTDSNVLLVAAENGIFLTGDGGKTWNAGATNVAVTGVFIDPRDSHHFFAGGADGSIAESKDAAISFKPY
jgi:photosystem II stability/assembly factor-like uncharacterized protein